VHRSADLEALRGDWPAPRRAQGRVEAAVEAWWARAEVSPVRAELERYGTGQALADCPSLSALVSDLGVARAALAALVDPLCAALRAEPLAHVPFRQQLSGGVAVLQLAQAGGAALTLVSHDAHVAQGNAGAVTFSDSEGRELVLAGAADLRVVDLLAEASPRARLDSEPRRIVTGESFDFTRDRARIVERAHGALVLLRLARAPGHPGPSQTFSFPDGTLLHRASGDRCESHRELAIALLGRMRRTDAAPILSDITREGSDHFRWQALRECLALDTAQGFAALARIAADARDPLSGPAGALRAQLIEQQPQLSRLEDVACHG
jgi:hypothetical protein